MYANKLLCNRIVYEIHSFRYLAGYPLSIGYLGKFLSSYCQPKLSA